MSKTKKKSNKSSKSNEITKRSAMVNTLVHVLAYLNAPICNLDSMYNKLSDILEVPKEMQILYDYVFYELGENTAMHDELGTVTDNLSKSEAKQTWGIYNKYAKLHVDKVMKAFSGVELNFEDYYSFKFQLDSILASRSADSTFFKTSQEIDIFLSILYRITVVIDIFFTNSFKWKITGVDIEKNRLKYIPAECYWDSIMGCYRYVSDREDFAKCTNYMFTQFPKQMGVPLEAYTIVMLTDKVDDNFRLYYDRCILVDIANQKRSRFLLQPPSRDILIATNSNRVQVSAIRTSHFRERKCLSAREGNLVLCDNDEVVFESFLIKDIDIGNSPYIALGYKLKSGLEDTLIIPIKFDSVLQTPYISVIISALEFYGVEYYSTDSSKELYKDCEVVSPYYWKYRYSKYTSKGDKVLKSGTKVREYKEVIIGIHTAKLGNPSPSALALAREKCIVLEEGETLVREHVRHYNKEAKLEEVN